MSEELTEEELRQFRQLLADRERIQALLVADARRQWLVSSVAGASRWIAVVVAAWFAVKGMLSEFFPWVR